MEIKNIENLASQFICQDAVGLITKSLGDSCRSEKIYVNIDSVPPGAFSTKYHSHSQQEEFFIILSGTGTLRLNDEEQIVKQGDYFAKPGARNIAHTFYNSSEADLVILDIGTREPEDTCYYPDEDVYMQKANGTRRIYHGSAFDKTWSSEPNAN